MDTQVKIIETPSQTPTQEILAKNNAPITIKDSLGRQIVLKKPNALRQFQLIEMVGNEAAKNEVYMIMASQLLFVDSIDEIPVTLNSKRELEALIARLDHEGINAIALALEENYGNKEKGEEREQIKK